MNIFAHILMKLQQREFYNYNIKIIKHHGQLDFVQAWKAGSILKNHCNLSSLQAKDENSHDHIVDTEKAVNKIQHLLMIKTLSRHKHKVKIEENFFKLLRACP